MRVAVDFMLLLPFWRFVGGSGEVNFLYVVGIAKEDIDVFVEISWPVEVALAKEHIHVFMFQVAMVRGGKRPSVLVCSQCWTNEVVVDWFS
jgi:hypothetical protein